MIKNIGLSLIIFLSSCDDSKKVKHQKINNHRLSKIEAIKIKEELY